MAMFVAIGNKDGVRHLRWTGNGNHFVTCCEDGSVILDGKYMTLEQATKRLLLTDGVPLTLFWEQDI